MVFRVCSVGGTIYGQIPDLSAPSSSTSKEKARDIVPKLSTDEMVMEPLQLEEELELEEFHPSPMAGRIEGGAGAGVSGLVNGHSSSVASIDSLIDSPRTAIKTPDIEFDDPKIFQHIDDGKHTAKIA